MIWPIIMPKSLTHGGVVICCDLLKALPHPVGVCLQPGGGTGTDNTDTTTCLYKHLHYRKHQREKCFLLTFQNVDMVWHQEWQLQIQVPLWGKSKNQSRHIKQGTSCHNWTPLLFDNVKRIQRKETYSISLYILINCCLKEKKHINNRLCTIPYLVSSAILNYKKRQAPSLFMVCCLYSVAVSALTWEKVWPFLVSTHVECDPS